MFDRLKNIYRKIIDTITPKNRLQQLDTFNYEKLIELMKERGTFQEFEDELNNFDEIEEFMRNKTNLHGINHIVRVLFNAYAMVTLENVSAEDKRIIIEAAKLHDIGRIQDGEDEGHGIQSAIKARKILEDKGFSAEEIEIICFIIEEHCLPKNKNNEDIQKLPEEIRQRYEYCLNLLKDADKLDRVRLGDLNPQRLSTDSAKRLVEVAKDVFENNRHYYKKKMKVYPFNEEDARKIFEEIESLEININFEEIKKNYSKYKSLQEQDKIKWLKYRIVDIQLDDFIEIANFLSKEDLDYFRNNFRLGPRLVIEAIYSMGIDRFMQLKANGRFDKFMDIQNYTKIVAEMTKEEQDLLLDFRKYDFGKQVLKKFYLYYHFIKKGDTEKINILLLHDKDLRQYMNSRMGGKSSGYKWFENTIFLPVEYVMVAIDKMNTKLILDIRENSNIPLNMIITAMIELNLFEEDIERKDLEKILLNYYKFNINVKQDKNEEQVKRLLLSLPDDLSNDYEAIIKECTVGRFKRFNLEDFEQIKNYEKICDEKILQEFEKTDDINELRKFVLETKIRDLDGMKRDIYFYKKYMGKKASENEVFNLFQTLLESQDKEELLEAYKKLNGISAEFDLDVALSDIRETLSEISREDIVSTLSGMKEKIENAETRNIKGQEVVDLTGTDFNLLISVIGSSGSPYLVAYYNNSISKLRKFENIQRLYKIFKIKSEIEIKLGTKRLVNKRYKIDPFKNKQRCVSSIDQDFIGHIRSEKDLSEDKQMREKLILAYFPQSKTDISYMGNQDLMTIYDKDRKDPTRKRIPHRDNTQGVCNLKLQDLNDTTLGEDNELVIDSYPGAIMCFDEVSDIARKTAKKLNIPILYLDSKKQFEIMKQKLDRYYAEIQEKLSQSSQMTDEFFQYAFNAFGNNIIHNAFKMANGFTFLDDDEYPQEEIIGIFAKMANLTDESLKRCNSDQREVIKAIMLKEANIMNIRYGSYYNFISFKALIDLVSRKDEAHQVNR